MKVLMLIVAVGLLFVGCSNPLDPNEGIRVERYTVTNTVHDTVYVTNTVTNEIWYWKTNVSTNMVTNTIDSARVDLVNSQTGWSTITLFGVNPNIDPANINIWGNLNRDGVAWVYTYNGVNIGCSNNMIYVYTPGINDYWKAGYFYGTSYIYIALPVVVTNVVLTNR